MNSVLRSPRPRLSAVLVPVDDGMKGRKRFQATERCQAPGQTVPVRTCKYSCRQWLLATARAGDVQVCSSVNTTKFPTEEHFVRPCRSLDVYFDSTLTRLFRSRTNGSALKKWARNIVMSWVVKENWLLVVCVSVVVSTFLSLFPYL